MFKYFYRYFYVSNIYNCNDFRLVLNAASGLQILNLRNSTFSEPNLLPNKTPNPTNIRYYLEPKLIDALSLQFQQVPVINANLQCHQLDLHFDVYSPSVEVVEIKEKLVNFLAKQRSLKILSLHNLNLGAFLVFVNDWSDQVEFDLDELLLQECFLNSADQNVFIQR